MKLGIRSIVEKKDGLYTRRALFYQDILRYFFVTREENKDSFKDRELAYWLLENNQELKSYYVDSDKNTAPSKRMENRLDRVQRSVKDLIDLGSMVGAGTAPDEKGETRQVQLYCYTLDGQLLACIIKSLDPTMREKADSEAYNYTIN